MTGHSRVKDTVKEISPWESMPFVTGKAEHFEIAPQAIRHARDHGFEVHYNHPEFRTAFAVKAYRH